MRPIVIRALLLPLPIDAGQVGARRCPDARGFREGRQKLLVALAAVAPDDAAQCRVGFERGGIDADRLPFNQAGRAQALQHPCEHSAMCFQIDQSTRARNRRMVWRRAVQSDAEEVAQCERVRRPPRDAALRIDALEVANQQQPEIDARRQARPAHRDGVERGALGFGEVVEPMLAQQLIQSHVERVTHRRRKIRRGDPHGWLSGAFPFAHCHAHRVVRG